MQLSITATRYHVNHDDDNEKRRERCRQWRRRCQCRRIRFNETRSRGDSLRRRLLLRRPRDSSSIRSLPFYSPAFYYSPLTFFFHSVYRVIHTLCRRRPSFSSSPNSRHYSVDARLSSRMHARTDYLLRQQRRQQRRRRRRRRLKFVIKNVSLSKPLVARTSLKKYRYSLLHYSRYTFSYVPTNIL